MNGQALVKLLLPQLPQLSLGALLGFAVAIALKQFGRTALLMLGALFICVQGLVSLDLVTVNWLKMSALAQPLLLQGGEQGSIWLQRILTANLPFAGTFTTGLMLGLRSKL